MDTCVWMLNKSPRSYAYIQSGYLINRLNEQHKTSSYEGQKMYICPFSISPPQCASLLSPCSLIIVLQYNLINHSAYSLFVSQWYMLFISSLPKGKIYCSLICLIKNLNELGDVSFALLSENKQWGLLTSDSSKTSVKVQVASSDLKVLFEFASKTCQFSFWAHLN